MTNGPVVNCIVLNWRTAEMSLEAAEAALEQMEGIAGGVTIVDNDSGDGSFEKILAEAEARGWLASGRVQVVQSGWNGGFGAGNNVGIRQGAPGASHTDLHYLLNSDAIPQPGAIRLLVEYLQARPQVGIACSRIRGPDGAPHLTAFRFPGAGSEFEASARTGPISTLLKASIVTLPQPTVSGQVDWAAGASMMIRTPVLDRIGLFDEGFFLYYEETDLCLRAAKAGWQTHYVVESEVVHIGSVSTGMKTWKRPPDYWYNSRRRYFEKHHGRIGALWATASNLAGAGLFRLRCILQRREWDAAKGHASYLFRHALTRQPRPVHIEKGKP